MEEKYPYLGRNFINEKPYVVLFVEQDYGIVVMNDTESENITFGKIGNFDETKFEILPPEECVRLQN